MSTMNLKPTSWVGDMYYRFENLCLEMEEAIYQCQDTVKYVEDQMQTVKNFYTDVMQDMLPPTESDSEKEENSDVVMSKNSEVINEKSVNNEAEQMLNNSHGAVNGKHSIDDASCCLVQCDVNKSCDLASHSVEQCSNGDNESQSAKLNLETYAPKDLNEAKDSDCKCISALSNPNESMQKESVEKSICSKIQGGTSDHSLGHENVRSTSGSMIKESYHEKDGVWTDEQMIEDYRSADVVYGCETTDNSNGNLFLGVDGTSKSLVASKCESGDINDQVVLHENRFDEAKLGESCVLVEKNEHSFTTSLSQKPKSYKKKIRDVFIQRRWLKGKQDKKQLALWYEEQSAKNSACNLLMTATTKDLQLSEIVESEWELL